jgi:hypothetical protein
MWGLWAVIQLFVVVTWELKLKTSVKMGVFKTWEVLFCSKLILCKWHSGPGMSETRILNTVVSFKTLPGGVTASDKGFCLNYLAHSTY